MRSSPNIRHYLPELVVTVFRSPEVQPWREIRHALHVPQSVALQKFARFVRANPTVGSGGDAAVSTGATSNGDIRFFEASVFGHPLETLAGVTDELLCQSAARAGKPYYQSALDPLAWRVAPIESHLPDALIPGRREIGIDVTQSWGAVYPRSGFVIQQNSAKAAAVVAQRACDIVIGPRRQHVAVALGDPGRYTTVPTELDERDAATGIWQMVSPKVDEACELFGSTDPDWSIGRIDNSRAFIWNLWRPYECCEPRGEKYLGSVHF